MKFRFPIVIIDEDYRSENASGLGIRESASLDHDPDHCDHGELRRLHNLAQIQKSTHPRTYEGHRRVHGDRNPVLYHLLPVDRCAGHALVQSAILHPHCGNDDRQLHDWNFPSR